MPMTQLSIGGEFAVLFSVKFEHDFYEGNVCNDFVVEPTAATAALIKNYRLLFFPRPDGFQVVYEKLEKAKPLLQIDKLPLVFSFTVRNANRLFGNFTEAPFPLNGQFFYFNNLSYLAVPEGVETRYLQLGEAVGEKDLVAQLPPDPNNPELPRSPATSLGKIPFGFIDIHVNDQVDKRMAIRLAGLLKTRPYVVRFKRKAIKVRYYLTPQKTSNTYTNHQIEEIDGKLKFDKAVEIPLTNGIMSWSIESSKPLELQKFLKNKFQLKMQKPGKDVFVTLDLPLPNVAEVQYDAKGKYWYAPVWVNI